jgi:hypothetical protein
MTLPILPNIPVKGIFPRDIIHTIFMTYTYTNIGLSIWAQEVEVKLMWGTLKKFDEQAAIRKICTDYGIEINMETTEVLRGTKLTIEVTLRP